MRLESSIVLLLSLALFTAVAQSIRKVGSWRRRNNGAERLLTIRALVGDSDARYRLGIRRLERSHDAAGVRWLVKSAEAGNGAAQNIIGLMYELGRGVAKDYGEAAKWYGKAAGAGFVASEVNLGNLYALGRGVERNYREALKWLEEASARGSLEGKNSLSWLLATCRDGTIRNGRRAIGILRPIVDRGERHVVLLDTLAAAYAEAGMFPEALELLSEALSKTNRASDEDFFRQLQKRKGGYEAGKPWREPPQQGLRWENEPVEIGSCERTEEGNGPAGAEAQASADETTAFVPGQPEATRAGLVDGTDSGQREHQEGEMDSPPQVDHIVEKLLVIEELLRPLKNEEENSYREAKPNGIVLNELAPMDSGPCSQRADREGPGETDVSSAARTFAEGFVLALLAGRYREVYQVMDSAFRAVVPENQMAPMVEQMYDAYGGKPIEAELKAEERGYRSYDGLQKPVHKFWYGLRSTRFGKDVFSLFVEIVTYEQGFMCSSFFVTPTKKSSRK